MADIQLREIKIGAGAAGFNFLPIFLAQHFGLFARRGINVTVQRTGTTDKATAALASGELDLAMTPPEGAIASYASGGRLRIIGGNLNTLPLTLIANPRFKKPEDLRGASLGTSSLTEGTALYTMEILSRHGLHYPGDYEFVISAFTPPDGKPSRPARWTRRSNWFRLTSLRWMRVTAISATLTTTYPRSLSYRSSLTRLGQLRTVRF